MTALSELLTQSNVNGWSTREIARQAEKKEHQLAQPTVSKYMGGRHGIPTEPVLEAFSDVLNIPIDKLREAAGVPQGADAPWSPPAEANRLDRRQRRALEELIRSMVTSETIGEDDQDDQSVTARMARDAQRDGITSGKRRRAPSRDGQAIVQMLDEAERGEVELTRQDFDRAADDSGPSLLEADDARASVRGEESQDPGSDDPA